MAPMNKSLTINIPPNRALLFNFWATALVIQGVTKKCNKYEYVQSFIPSRDDPLKLELFEFTLTDFRALMEFPPKPANSKTYDPLPAEEKMISFLDEINYQWEKSKTVIAIKRRKMSSEFSYLFAYFIQYISGKVGNHDQDSTIHVQVVFFAVKNRRID